jgi:beta-aspartyl-peptidase (threonine type)
MGRDEESIAAPMPLRLWEEPPRGGYALAIHGGAGGRIKELSAESRAEFEGGLTLAHEAGTAVLADGGSAVDAVCAAVEQLENHPLFNAGRGAALTSEGRAELDAAVMDGGTGLAGAIATSKHAKNPVFLARSVMERSDHLLLVDPSRKLVASWDLETVDPDYFVTEARIDQLARIRSLEVPAARHGTVGAVARDSRGDIAAATSTGGMAGQHEGRVGDSPLIGSGTYARNGLAAISCTGEGEAFIRGVVAYDIAARMRYLGSGLGEAVTRTVETELTERGASGGLVAVDGDGRIVVAHNSPTMFAAFANEDGLVMLT